MQMCHQRGNIPEFLASIKTSYTKKKHWPDFPVDWKLSSVISGFTILVPTSVLLVLEQLPPFDLPKAIFHLQILSSSPVLESLSEWSRNFAPLHLCITERWISALGLLHSCVWTKLPQSQRGWLNLILILYSSQQITNYQGEYIKDTVAFLVPGNDIYFFSIDISQRLSVFMGFSCKYPFVNKLYWKSYIFAYFFLSKKISYCAYTVTCALENSSLDISLI